MQIVVPLAGSDFLRPDGSLKPLTDFDGRPLLQHVLQSRIWARDAAPTDYTFVLHDSTPARAFARDYLQTWFPGAREVFVSDYTQGAAMSAAVGVVCRAGQTDGPLVVDLADILYACDSNPLEAFANTANCGGVGLVFDSDNPIYSYLRTDAAGAFVEAAEKRVISRNASAGTYMFVDAACYLRALASALDNTETQTYRDLYFVCPLFNGVHAQGRAVVLLPVKSVVDIKKTNE